MREGEPGSTDFRRIGAWWAAEEDSSLALRMTAGERSHERASWAGDSAELKVIAEMGSTRPVVELVPLISAGDSAELKLCGYWCGNVAYRLIG